MRKIFTILLCLLPAMSFAQVNNGGFEATPYDDGWTAGNSATIEEETNAVNVHTGLKSLKFTSGSNTSVLKLSSAYTPGVGNYMASVWVKGTAGTEVKLQNIVNNGKNNYMNYIHVLGATDTWEKVEAPFAIDKGATTYKIQIQGTTVDAVYYMDDVEITSISTTGVLNGDFEAGAEINWYSVEEKNSATASLSTELDDVQEGTKALKIEVTGVAETPSIGDVQTKNAGLTPLNGSPKVISFYAKAVSAVPGLMPKGMIAQAYTDAIGKGLNAGVYSGTFSLTGEYRQYKFALSHLYDGANEASYVTNTIRCGEVVGTYYFDNITYEDYPGTPSIISTANTDAQVGKEYSYQAQSSNPGIGKWILTKPETGAEWLSIDQYTGELKGTPDAVGSFEVTITLSDGIADVPQIFTINVSTATAIEKIEGGLKFYPNPMQSELRIMTDAKVNKIEVFSLTGQKVASDYTGSKQVNVAGLSKGVYIVSVEADGQTIRKKVTKQ